ncbi:MAG: 3D domain-containing protein, partial [Clostridium perfringens]|nr:3D domain-containing protein [Clostridium perfringens]
DTGGAIKGNRVDLFFNTEAEASNWGVRNLDVYILN